MVQKVCEKLKLTLKKPNDISKMAADRLLDKIYSLFGTNKIILLAIRFSTFRSWGIDKLFDAIGY